MTFLENLKNSREFPPGISGTIDFREFPVELVIDCAGALWEESIGASPLYHL